MRLLVDADVLLYKAAFRVEQEIWWPDDIVTMHSKKTVEINNTDAEGRVILADAVSWAARVLKGDVYSETVQRVICDETNEVYLRRSREVIKLRPEEG